MFCTHFLVRRYDVLHKNQRAIRALFHLNYVLIFECFEERKDRVPAPFPLFGEVADLSEKRNADASVVVRFELRYLSADKILESLETRRSVRQ